MHVLRTLFSAILLVLWHVRGRRSKEVVNIVIGQTQNKEPLKITLSMYCILHLLLVLLHITKSLNFGIPNTNNALSLSMHKVNETLFKTTTALVQSFILSISVRRPTDKLCKNLGAGLGQPL